MKCNEVKIVKNEIEPVEPSKRYTVPVRKDYPTEGTRKVKVIE